MQFIVAWLVGMAAPSFINAVLKRVVVGLGISMITYTGVGLILDHALAGVSTGMGGIPSAMFGVLKLGGFHEVVSIYVSAFTAKITLKGLTSAGTLSTLNWNNPQQGIFGF